MPAKNKQRSKDYRSLPAYPITEVAHYLSVPQSTVRYWSSGQDNYAPLIDVPAIDPVLLSFLNVVELHVLSAIRRKHTISMPKVRTALEFLRNYSTNAHDQRHPLISRQLETDGLDLFIDHYGQLVNISRAGQTAIREVMGHALKRIERDTRGIPIRLFPFTRNQLSNAPAIVVMDPRISAGRPVIVGTGLATEIIAERYKAGDSIRELAKDYERKPTEIEEAIRCELKPAA